MKRCEERVSCPQLRMMRKSLNLSPLTALCGIIAHLHIVLPDVLDCKYLCYLNLVPLLCLAFSRFDTMPSRVDWNGGIMQTLDRILFSSCPRVLSHFATVVFAVCLDPSLAKDGC